jgi:nucleobase:cation symporter-1, NCS1 family
MSSTNFSAVGEPGPAADTSVRVIERRSIDHIPLAERHGKPWDNVPIWFLCTATILDLALGAVGVLGGLSLTWALVAIVVGASFGTVFAGFHSSQGPQLGLPQMIQSRPQFGYRGAILIYLVALVTFLLFNIFTLVYVGQVVESVLGLPKSVGMIATAVIGTFVAVVGYNLVQKFAKWVATAFVVVFGILTIAAPFALEFPAGSEAGGFSLEIFMVQTAIAAAVTLSWAPYVSDYTRYLPPARTRSIFVWTFGAMALSAIWVLGLGAVITSAFPISDTVQAFNLAGDEVFGGFGTVVIAVAAVASFQLFTMDVYGSSLTVISIVDSFKPVKPSATLRAGVSVIVGAVGLVLAFVVTGDVLAQFANLFNILLYLLAPWTAINLVDFFFVRHGHYSIREIFNPRGMYGAWNWRGYLAYVAGLAAMIPFASTAWWSGPAMTALGFDIAPYVGIFVGGAVYLMVCRNLDLAHERAIIEQADAGLESAPLVETNPVVVAQPPPATSL